MAFYRAHVLVCGGTPCELGGCRAVKDTLLEEVNRLGLSSEIRVLETGCLGPCDQGPVIIVYPEGIMYARLQPGDVKEIVEQHLLKGRVVNRLVYHEKKEEAKSVVTFESSDYFGLQERIVLRNCGRINPESIEEYIAHDGYRALGKCLTEMEPAAVVQVVKDSGLRGRGGAGFPTGLKWSFTAKTDSNQKYIVCNADEGEPGTFKDRLILEGDPHSIIEGMAIAGYAVGANKGYIYIRGEYKLSIERLQHAIRQARELGLLGTNIFGSDFAFDIEVRSGAGAYVCGEETALIESIEGSRGEPRYKPPFPGVSGIWGKPTVVNNVETLANIAPIILNGAAWFRGFGTEKCPGTKVFTMTGDINNEGLIEVPMGITLRQIVYGVGGGIPGGLGFKMAQTGGTSGGCLPKEFLDLPMDYDTLAEAGSALGSGALLIMDDSHCIVDIVRCFMKFFKHESCGKCTPCREGTTRLYELVTKITEGKATNEDIALLTELSRVMQTSALCGLGQAAPNPLVTCLKYFEEEFGAHLNGYCPTGVCTMPVANVKVG
ncbi:MAG TPA: NADH-quinone oxidoreductase subunit NuoF [Firmicutes bacterium]|jgi:NADP-reducing hydrogenase subunit HndC|nr:NADH-quinone oxidoreductase subunit NuoF [Bacillota bacterium]HOQ24613.1 NADH-quinone oxidoreductase subunit NuoF [Bacillota bacterium]HPT67958.1 NADH-quinone oxidoreductase subunit NuoF [Bacillota bacterium]